MRPDWRLRAEARARAHHFDEKGVCRRCRLTAQDLTARPVPCDQATRARLDRIARKAMQIDVLHRAIRR